MIARARRRERQVPVTVSHADPVVLPDRPPEVVSAPPADVLPDRPTWDVRARARIARVTRRVRRRQRLIGVILALVLVAALVVAVPAVIRARDVDRWERCVKRTTASTLVAGAAVPRSVLDACGPKPGTHRVPADRRN